MPEIREDPLTEDSVIIAANRDDRPYEFEKAVPRRVGTTCPFCLGNEDETPAEVAHYANEQANGATTWNVRVVPNKYPAVLPQAEHLTAERRFQESSPAFGKHEVIVESAQHKVSFSELTPTEARLACLAYRDRLRAARDSDGIKFAHVFKNTGPAAGASLEHVHTQLIGLPTVPTRVSRILDNSTRLFHNGDEFPGKWLEQELGGGQRLVEQTDNLVAYCPFAARFPFETRITPVEGASDFLDADLDLINEFADLLQRMVRRIELASGRAAYNFSLNVAPFEPFAVRHFAWQLELFPRLSTPAGFEWATGWFINAVAPEVAAKILRDAPLGNALTTKEDNSTGITS